MPLKEIAVHLGRVTVLPRRQELRHLAVAVVSAFESQLRDHPADLGTFRKLNIVVGNSGRYGPLPLMEDHDRIAVVNLPAVADDLVGHSLAEQAVLLLDMLVAGIDVAASHMGTDVDVRRIAELAREAQFRTEVTERRRNRERTRYGTFRGVIDLDRTVLTLIATDGRTDDVLATEERRFPGEPLGPHAVRPGAEVGGR